MTRHHMTPEGPVPFTPEEEAEWDAREAAEAAGAVDRQWGEVRADRNSRLSATDWWVTKAVELGESLTDAQRVYRQELRDITQQADPFSIVWPEVPTL